MNNYQLSEKFNEMAVMCEYAGENIFKARAFLKTSEIISSLDFELYELESDFKIKGIGRGAEEIISDFLYSGRSKYYDELKARVPDDIFLMLNISGIGVKKLKILCQTLKINKISELFEKAINGEVKTVKGFSASSEASIIREISRIKSEINSKLFFVAEKLFYDIKHHLNRVDLIKQIAPAGEFARKLPVIKKMSCSVIYDSQIGPEKSAAEIKNALKLSVGELSEESGGLSILKTRNFSGDFPLEFFLIRSGDNCEKIKKILTLSADYIKAQIKENKDFDSGINAYGIKTISKDEFILKTMPAMIKNFGSLNFVRTAPEHSELVWKTLPPPVFKELKPFTTDKIKGTFHVHSDYSDGADSLETIARSAKEMGLSYIGITDHSKTSFYAGGLSAEKLRGQIKEIDSLNLKYAPFKIFKGIECDILKDGSLDFSDDILKELDFVIVSIHSHFKMPGAEMSERIRRAISNPYVTMLGHISGRLLTNRAGYSFDEEIIFAEAKKNNVIIELNSNPYRMDIDYKHFGRLSELGIMISINPDSHSISDAMPCINYGVNAVNLGAMPESGIFNVKTVEEVENFFKFKKEIAGGLDFK